MEYVLDSSVIVKWFSHIDEEHVNKALTVLNLYRDNKIDIYVPELAIYELSNVLRYNKNFSSIETREIIKTLVSLELKVVSLNISIIDLAIKIAYDDNITIYDAIFLSLSNALKIPLVSANPRHHKLLRRRNIIFLKDF